MLQKVNYPSYLRPDFDRYAPGWERKAKDADKKAADANAQLEIMKARDEEQRESLEKAARAGQELFGRPASTDSSIATSARVSRCSRSTV